MKDQNAYTKNDTKSGIQKKGLSYFFNSFASVITKTAGNVYAFILAIVVVIIWGISGPIFHFSDTWQLVINTGTTIITFLMVFIIQHSQNKDTIALQLKLDELIAASSASNKLINIENLTEEELAKFEKYFISLAKEAAKDKEELNQNMEGKENLTNQ